MSKPLEIVERIVRNLPILGEPEFLYTDLPYGRLYYALGLDGRGCYHGVWAFTEGPGMCQPIEFAPNQSRTLVIKELIEQGGGLMSDLHIRGMLTREYWNARRNKK